VWRENLGESIREGGKDPEYGGSCKGRLKGKNVLAQQKEVPGGRGGYGERG